MAALSFDDQKKGWRVNFLNASGKRKRKFFHLKVNAQDFFKVCEDREERIKNRLGWVDAISFEAAIEVYKQKYLKLKSKTHCITAYRRFLYLKPHFENKTLCDVTFHDIDQMMR